MTAILREEKATFPLYADSRRQEKQIGRENKVSSVEGILHFYQHISKLYLAGGA